MNFEDKLFGKPFKCVGLWWLLVARPPTESWFKVAPSPQASDFDFLNTRNVTINDGPSLGHLGHLFSHQEFFSLWWRLLSDMTCTWGLRNAFLWFISFDHIHCSFPQKGAFAAKLSQFCASSQSTFGQCSSNHCNYPHKFAPFIWQCCQIVWPGKSRCSDVRRMRGDCRPFFQRCLSEQCWMFDACLLDVGSNLHILSRLFFSSLQIEWSATGWKESADIFHQIRHQGPPMRGVVNRFIMQRAALIMANDIPLMAIEDVIKAVCEYSPLRGQ